jgi:hypothetical protein
MVSIIFIANVQDSRCGMPTLLIAKVPSNLSIPFMSKPTTIFSFWNGHINNYIYGVLGFANKYFCDNGAVVVFHEDDPCVLKEIKSYLETNGYEIHSRSTQGGQLSTF